MRRVLIPASRLLFSAYSVLVACYCILAYVPFTYHQVLAGRLLPWLDSAARLHHWVNLGMTAVVLVTLAAPLRRGGWIRRAGFGLAAWLAVTSLACLVHPVLPGLTSGWSAFWLGLAALVGPVWLGLLDGAALGRDVAWSERLAGTGAAHFGTAWRSALFVPLLYAGIAAGLASPRFSLMEGLPLVARTALLHLVLFSALFLVLGWLLSLASCFGVPAQAEFWLCHLLLAVAVASLLTAVACPAIGFTGWPAPVFCGVLGLVLAAANAGAALHLAGGRSVSDGIELAVLPSTLGLVHSPASGAGMLLAVAAGAFWAIRRAASMDWNYLVQELLAAAVWALTFACFYAIGGRRARARGMAWLAAPLLVVTLYRVVDAAQPAPAGLERWAGYDTSYRLIRSFLARDTGRGSFYQFLARNTSIAASIHVDPAPVDLVLPLQPARGPLPHVFIVTIDSLRRDYLSPYNPAVTFTPAIEAFARESTVFRNAFTHYGGTGLSEPSIWSGAMLLHKQYVTPFAPMNALEKLLRADQYRIFVSRDSILQTVLARAPDDVELDRPDAEGTYELSQSLTRLAAEIDRHGSDARPFFGYTQPQNIHIAVIRREGATVPPGEAYPGFYAPYASRLQHVDGAFGRFVAYLKQRGLYDRSILILTADHGDSLGEEGRWGHAYTLFPEIVRIPMIVHLPPGLAARVSADPDLPAFSTDLTPSLYYLLGHRPVRHDELFGSPLFTETPPERARDPKATYLLAASYGAVYAVLSGNGHTLYVADGVNYRSYRFDLSASGAQAGAVTDAIRREGDERIRHGIQTINRFYHFGDRDSAVRP